MAKKIDNLELGTVTYVYMTHDGGGKVEDIYQLVGNLSDHVQVVNHNNLVDLALEREEYILNIPNETEFI